MKKLFELIFTGGVWVFPFCFFYFVIAMAILSIDQCEHVLCNVFAGYFIAFSILSFILSEIKYDWFGKARFWYYGVIVTVFALISYQMISSL